MIPAAFDYQDPADTERGWDDEDTRVDECVHGEHPIECSLCTSAGLIAAVSGEGEEHVTEDKQQEVTIAVEMMRTCCNPAHLFLGTYVDNVRDMIAKGRGGWLKGERCASSKLKQRDVDRIRKLHATGKYNYIRLAEMFGCNASNIGLIVRRRSWT